MLKLFLFFSLFVFNLSSSQVEKNILIIADSIGVGIKGEKPFPVILQALIPDHHVINNSIGGSMYLSAPDRLLTVLSNQRIDILVITLGINDLGGKRPLKEIYDNALRIVQECKKRNIKLFMGIVEAHSFHWMTNDYSYENKFDSIFTYLKNKLGINTFSFLGKDMQKYTYDGFHLNDDGQKIMANRIKSIIQL